MKHVTKHKDMQKWMLEFPSQFENRGIKISRVDSIISPNLSIYFTYCVGVRCDRNRFSVHSPFIEKCMVTFKMNLE